MSTVLALESDDRRIGLLRAVVCDRLRASLMVADSAESAVAAISAHVPDVVLVSPDFPPRAEIEVKDYLRSLQRPTVPEILRVPALSPKAPARTRTGLLGALRRRAAGISEDSSENNDFAALGARIAGALDRARSARADASNNVPTPQPARESCAKGAPDSAVRTAAGSTEPAFTLEAPRAGTRVGKPGTSLAPVNSSASTSSDVADDNQNEWGLFEPSRCGYAALAATLAATFDAVPEEVQESAAPSPADMLLGLETEADPMARPEPPVVLASAPTSPGASPPVRACQEVPTAARRERKRDQPAPLALWAHFLEREDERSASHALPTYSEAMADVVALLVGVNAPARIAGVQYGSGCRVHQVRGLACWEPTGPAVFEVASSEPDPSLVFHSAVSESTPAA